MNAHIRIDEGSRIQSVEYLTGAGLEPVVSVCFEKNGTFVWLKIDPALALQLADCIVPVVTARTLEAA